MTKHDPHVLISGSGIAGTALALCLVERGIRTTLVERDDAPREGGQVVDLRGASREAAERMGLMPGIRAHQLHEKGIAYVNSRGRVHARMSMEDYDGKGAVAEIEISRGDLHRVLLERLEEANSAVPELLTVRYGDRISDLVQDGDGADVTFASGSRTRYELVVGADGVHSATRRMVFGPEEQFSTYLGGYTAFFSMPTPPEIEPGWFTMRAAPGAAVGIRPGSHPATSMVLVTIRTARDSGLRRDRSAQLALVRHMISSAGWHAPAMLSALESAHDFYFDELVRIDVPDLVHGRVTLIGDASSSGSPLSGMGTATALIGARLLSAEVAASPNDMTRAAERYAAKVAPFARAGQAVPGGGIRFMVPGSKLGNFCAQLTMRILVSRAFRPVMKRMIGGSQDAELSLPEEQTVAPH
ncbi:FAD-dependent monooxygenase [Microbacterium sp. MPKO10]|uniref:FAD-dependent monooxygenase n=1 Tax=Microbacterium sp. MPKO10 TaxID=2989818 RepID=UPI0022355D88|nr:FAD-dependent monooxygenase [Microbacterium sp. MPKO10]MCW4456883.1 FAD-dependent monooxygenase [Microbacterium sp. MPKO10]